MPQIEDELSDVVSKAQRGLGLPSSLLAEKAHHELAKVRALRSGAPEEATVRAIAPILKLNTESLLKLHAGAYDPQAHAPAGCQRIDTPAPTQGYEAMRVNAFLLSPPGRKEAVLFDTGTSLEALQKALGDKILSAVCVTHTHWDHVKILPDIVQHFPNVTIYGPTLVGVSKQVILKGGEQLQLAGLEVKVSPTRGHAPDGLSYIIRGLATPVAVVGDAIFAGSIGGVPEDAYQAALDAVRKNILTLEDETILAPGHACLSTVGYEKAHNPFFAGI